MPEPTVAINRVMLMALVSKCPPAIAATWLNAFSTSSAENMYCELRSWRAVNLSRRQKACNHANQYRSQENVPLGILYLFRQG